MNLDGEEFALDHYGPGQGRTTRTWILAIMSGILCLATVLYFAFLQVSTGSSFWPFPGFYFIEIVLLGSLGLVSLIKQTPGGKIFWNSLPWIGAGGLFAFVILGAWTIGFFLILPMILSIAAGVLEDRRKKDNLPLHVIFFLFAAFAQAVIVLLVLSVNSS